MRQVPLSPPAPTSKRVANVPEHPPPSTRLMPCAHVANRHIPQIIGARCFDNRICIASVSSYESLGSVLTNRHDFANAALMRSAVSGSSSLLFVMPPTLEPFTLCDI